MPKHKPITLPLPEKVLKDFQRRVTPGDPAQCWAWPGTVSLKGYGTLPVPEFHYFLAHRVAYALSHNVDPGPQCVLHTCDNPPCVNPAHLWLGSKSDNSRDRTRKGRTAAGDRNGTHTHPDSVPKGVRRPAHKLTEDDVRTVRQLFSQGVLRSHLARRFQVSWMAIDALLQGHTWTHIR
jgi:hypothetical protein